MKWLITETRKYMVEAETKDEAENLYLEYGLQYVSFIGVPKRIVEEAEDVHA